MLSSFCRIFHPAGFFLNSGIMTLKHFHIACLLLFLADFLSGVFLNRLKMGGRFLIYVLPVLVLLLLGGGVSFRNGFCPQNFRTALNALSVLLFFSYVYGAVSL